MSDFFITCLQVHLTKFRKLGRPLITPDSCTVLSQFYIEYLPSNVLTVPSMSFSVSAKARSSALCLAVSELPTTLHAKTKLSVLTDTGKV